MAATRRRCRTRHRATGCAAEYGWREAETSAQGVNVMTYYHKLGELLHKRHTQFRKPDVNLYREEVMGLEGFSGIESVLYHHFLPPRVAHVGDCVPRRRNMSNLVRCA